MKEKEIKLVEWFKEKKQVITAFSGGVDSCLVAFMARKVLGKKNAIAMISISPSLKERELQGAEEFCANYDIQLIKILAKEIEDPNYVANPINRCYYCKSALYDEIFEQRDKLKLNNFFVLNGSNHSDFSDFRPGLQAAAENEILSPLAECGFVKDDIRLLSKKHNLNVWNKPASPCLGSRFPYGESISLEKLKKVEEAEYILNDAGFDECRVRYQDGVARLEVPKEQVVNLQAKISLLEPKIIGLGFSSCIIDNEGFVSGKLNSVISEEKINFQLNQQENWKISK